MKSSVTEKSENYLGSVKLSAGRKPHNLPISKIRFRRVNEKKKKIRKKKKDGL